MRRSARFNTLGGYRCYKCNTVKPYTEEFFVKDKTKPNGLSYLCKECMRKYGKAHYHRKEVRKNV